MYAMLTGNLPFTVEPFNIKSLYNKMMKNEMNPIPEHLSKSKFILNQNHLFWQVFDEWKLKFSRWRRFASQAFKSRPFETYLTQGSNGTPMD